MRKVTRQIAIAFLQGNSKSIGNSSTDGTNLYLHGNKIAYKYNGKLYMTLAGWNTPTTRERLNGLLDVIGIKHNYGFFQRDYEPFFIDNGYIRAIDSCEIVSINL